MIEIHTGLNGRFYPRYNGQLLRNDRGSLRSFRTAERAARAMNDALARNRGAEVFVRIGPCAAELMGVKLPTEAEYVATFTSPQRALRLAAAQLMGGHPQTECRREAFWLEVSDLTSEL